MLVNGGKFVVIIHIGGDIMPVRVNVRISDKASEWLDRKSAEMAVSKNALINLAIETYMKETEAVYMLPNLLRQIEKQRG